MDDKFAFLGSTRFWALVITGLAAVAHGNFTMQAWMEGVMIIVTGFAAVRTIDRNIGDKKVEAAEIAAKSQ